VARLRLGPRVAVLGACAVLLVSHYAGSLRWPFINDDYIFLDKTRALPFAGVWTMRDLLFHYYRPWSRELHYWVLQHLFGAWELPFHLASWVLWLAVMAGYYALVASLAGAGAALWYWGSDHAAAPEYITATVTRGDLIQSVSANGTLNPVLNVQVGSQISGNIQKLFADFNSLVKSNQVVAQLDPATYQAIVHQTEADLANAHAALELAQVEAKRSAALFKDRLVSESDNQKAAADLHQAEAQVKMKEASVEKARVDLGHCTIYAPVDGIVISRSVDVGQTVAASMNAPVLFIIANDLAKMQIDANVSEADVGGVHVAAATEVGTHNSESFASRRSIQRTPKLHRMKNQFSCASSGRG
jgi:multidrug efflux pump subunit AcrA (membrane-fusion protein)